VMGSTRGSTLSAGITRVTGTVIGTLVGGVVASGFGNQPWSLLVAVTLAVFSCNVLKLTDANRISGYIAAIVVLGYHDDPWVYAGGRFVETCIGIAVAIVMDELFWQTRAADKLRDNIQQMLRELGHFYQLIVECYITGEYRTKAIADQKARLIELIRVSEKLWQEAIAEHHRKLWVDETWEFLLRRTWEHILTMDYAAERRREGDTFWKGMEPQLIKLSEVTQTSFEQLADAVANHKSQPDLPDLDQSLREATQQLDTLQTHPDACYSPAELRRFFTFFYNMEEIAKKLVRMRTGL
ncbi:MAG TPA: FUSC family protein, partial [Allocoleopsis sp.]